MGKMAMDILEGAKKFGILSDILASTPCMCIEKSINMARWQMEEIACITDYVHG